MRVVIVMLMFLFLYSGLSGQNLVPNHSFEEISDTIGGFARSNVEFIDKIKYWISPNTATPDLITPDFDEKFVNPPAPRTGSNIIGIQCSKHIWEDKYWSECVGIELPKPLVANRTYLVEYYIRRADCLAPSKDKDEFMNDNFGILFTPEPINLNGADLITGNADIRGDASVLITNKEWVRISDYFTPKENSGFLYLGQFRNEGKEEQGIMKGYYVIDDISVMEMTDFGTLDEGVNLPVGSVIPLNDVNFDSGTTRLSDKKSHKVLRKLESYLKSNPAIKIRINGHTDSVGSDESNLSLSENRARTIANILIRNGIERERIEWKGFGENAPISDNDTVEGRLKNRRVEFEVIN